MFKKVGITTALSAALLFGGAFTSNAEASANQEQTFNPSYKIFYSVNGQWGSNSGSVSEANIQDLLDKVLNRFEINLNNINWQSLQNQDSAQATAKEPVEQEKPVKETPEKVENIETEKPAKEEAPSKEEPAKEEPVKEQPAEEKPVVEQPEQPEQPAEKTEAPVQQQPAQQEEQPSKTEQQSQQLSQFEQEVVELTNKERANNGLAPLEIDTELSKVAREKSKDMATAGYFDHNSPTYGSPFDMMKSFGIDYRTAGENIAQGQRTPEEVVNGWMNSEGHRANILNANYTHIGVGYVESGNHWTQQFIGK